VSAPREGYCNELLFFLFLCEEKETFEFFRLYVRKDISKNKEKKKLTRYIQLVFKTKNKQIGNFVSSQNSANTLLTHQPVGNKFDLFFSVIKHTHTEKTYHPDEAR